MREIDAILLHEGDLAASGKAHTWYEQWCEKANLFVCS